MGGRLVEVRVVGLANDSSAGLPISFYLGIRRDAECSAEPCL